MFSCTQSDRSGETMMDQQESSRPALEGSCLCGAVKFEVDGPVAGVGQCHCSLCRKVSGGASNSVFIIAFAALRWRSGEDMRRRYVLRNDWGTTRCTTCGSPLPESHDGKRWWVPAGLMDDDIGTTVKMHIHVASKADWETIHGAARQYREWPTLG